MPVTVLPPGLDLVLVRLTDEPEDGVEPGAGSLDGFIEATVTGIGRRARTSPTFRRSSVLKSAIARSTSPATRASAIASARSRTACSSIGAGCPIWVGGAMNGGFARLGRRMGCPAGPADSTDLLADDVVGKLDDQSVTANAGCEPEIGRTLSRDKVPLLVDAIHELATKDVARSSAESGAQRSAESGAQPIVSAACRPRSGPVRPQEAVIQRSASPTSSGSGWRGSGWRGRIRTFNPLIQSQVPYR